MYFIDKNVHFLHSGAPREQSYECPVCPKHFARKCDMSSHMNRVCHYDSSLKMRSIPSTQIRTGSTKLVRYMLDTYEPPQNTWHITWKGAVDHQVEKAAHALAHGLPIYWENGAQHASGLKLPQLKSTPFIECLEYLVGKMANPELTIGCKSERAAREKMVSKFSYLKNHS